MIIFEVLQKIKNYLQIYNKLYLNYNSKSENSLGYFKIEIQIPYAPTYFNHPQNQIVFYQQ